MLDLSPNGIHVTIKVVPAFAPRPFRDDHYPIYLPRVFKLTVIWPDGRRSTEVTADHNAAVRRLRYLAKPLDPWLIAFRGGTHELHHSDAGWHRAAEIEFDATFQPRVRLAGGGVHLIEGDDADWIINKWWESP
jgi:hypothetical protein